MEQEREALVPTLLDMNEPLPVEEIAKPANVEMNIEDFNGELLEDLDLEIKPVTKEVIVQV